MPLTFPTRLARGRFTRLAGALGLMLISGVVLAQDPKPLAIKPEAKPADPKAQALLEEVAKAYQALTSYSDQGAFVVSMTIGDKPQEQTVPVELTFVRPNKLSLAAGPVQLISDGKTLTTTIVPLKKYMTGPAPEHVTVETFREGPVGAAIFGGPSGVPMYILVNLLTAPEPVKAIEQLGGSLQLAADDDKGQAILIDQADGPDLRLVVDPATKLLKAVDLVIDPKALEESAQQGRPIKVAKLGWNSGTVTTEAAQAPTFAFEAPAGFTKVDSFQDHQDGDGEEEKFAVDELVGQPAPDFTLTVLDGPDKTKTVTKADLAGKVVVIDFWATWCGPCMIELPEIQKLVDELEKGKKEVLVVALSQDRDPAELAEVRKLVEKTLKEKKIDFSGKSVAAVALDPSNTVGESFQVEGLPTLVILDGKGVVQATHVGFSPDIREKLTLEIDTLLAGKPLPRPAKEAEEAAKKPEGDSEEK